MLIQNLNDLEKFAYNFAKNLKEGDVINLIGEMGSGKTTFTNYVCKYFGVSDSSSPTFAIVNIYEADKKIYHLDLYRFDDPDDILDIDYEEYFYPQDAITFIEWADKAKDYLPCEMINVWIEKIDQKSREIKVSDNFKQRSIDWWIY